MRWRDGVPRTVACVLFLGVAVQWAIAAPWGFASFPRVLSYIAVGVAPWLLLIALTAARRRGTAWLALGACTAALPLGLSGSSVFSWSTFPSPTLFDAARLTPLLAAFALLYAERSSPRGADAWRWRVMHTSLGAVLPWLPLYLYVAVDGFIWDQAPWWHAPEAALAVAPLMLGGVALARGRTWGILPTLVAVPLALLVNVPAAQHACLGPQGHPFAYGVARELVALSAALAVVPWLGPALWSLRIKTDTSTTSCGT